MIWDARKRIPLYTLSGHNAPIRALTVVNNEYLASCSHDLTIKLWSLRTYAQLKSWTGSDSRILVALAYDPELNMLVSGDNGGIKVWDSRLWTKCDNNYQEICVPND